LLLEDSMRRLSSACVIALLVPAVGFSHEAATDDFGALSPDAPPETAQFAFLIGAWNCKTRGMGPDGAIQDGPDASWTGYYILDGWAIQDDWVSPGPDGKLFRGTNVRSFNQKTGKWDNRWLPTGSLQWKYFDAEQVGEAMVMTGEDTDGMDRSFLDRNTFHEIETDSWKWRKDRSFDGGESWIEGVAFIHCQAHRDDG
jgi:hypothetical protein